ncbi:unnamed protein product [Adineta ricciae]|uniref:Uncharacterized protein n=1 Tax=Adineta ricciae TaxID=249248 RepID=A0A813T0D8_ADIRI|nr:unnamed protein product [Adineta ricciae]
MLSRNHVINLSTVRPQNIISTSSVYHRSDIDKQQQQISLRTKKTRTKSTANTSVATSTTSLIFVNITNLTVSFSPSTLSTPQQQISSEDSYSAKTGIKTAAILGGM